MRELPLSNCEKEFILKAVSENKRIDGRDCYDYRHMKITFGVDRGCCHVELGKTRVMCQVSCEVTTPKQARPSEGMIFVNVELSPMAAPQFEVGRQSDYGVEITRILERCIKESRCVDTESLCIMSGIKVWNVRVDIHVLNHEGGLIDASSIAAITALAHFRRPDVTVSGEEVTIHSLEDRDPVPLSVHHMPICVTFAFYDQGKYLLVDPSEKEERVMDGKMVIGMNKHREICTLQMAGSMMLLKDQVLKCSNIAVVKVTEISELIHRALENDSKARAAGDKFGFAVSINTEKITANEMESQDVDMDEVEQNIKDSSCSDSDENRTTESLDSEFNSKVISKSPGTMMIGEGGKNTWFVENGVSFKAPNNSKNLQHTPTTETRVPDPGSGDQAIELSDDSEEEEVVILASDDLNMGANQKTKTTEDSSEIDLSMALKKTVKTGKSKKQKQRPR